MDTWIFDNLENDVLVNVLDKLVWGNRQNHIRLSLRSATRLKSGIPLLSNVLKFQTLKY